MIPRHFSWLLDAFVLSLAFLGAYALVPVVHRSMEPGEILYWPWLFQIASPVTWSGLMPPLNDLIWTYAVMVVAVLLILVGTNGYDSLLTQSRSRVIAVALLAAAWGTGLITLTMFALKSVGWSRLFVVLFAVLTLVSLSGYRLLLRGYFLRRQRAGVYAKNVLLIGQKAAIVWMASYFAEYINRGDYAVLGQLCVNGDSAADQMPRLGHVTELGDLLIRRPIHEVIAIQPVGNGEWMESVIRNCDYMGVKLWIVPEVLLHEPRQLKTLYPFAALNLPAVVLTPPHWDSDALFVKRLLDLVVSGLLLVLLVPLFVLVGVIIKLTTPDLPVFYRWRVVGQSGVEFTGYKFTTMVADADERKVELEGRNEMDGPVFKIKNDPRVTPVGRFLRKFSINELPQLYSVLKGDMSLVGPRPAFRNELERYEFWHKRKLSIRPGITCLWQIRGRNKITDFDEWVRMDLEYIDNWSLWLDVKILFRTAWVVVRGTGS